MSGLFQLTWGTGMGRITRNYSFDGYGEQRGYTAKGWKLRCIAAGKREGLVYVKRRA